MQTHSALWRLDAYIERPTPYRVKHGGAPETRSDDETRAPAATDQVRDARGQGGFRNSWESSLEASINGLTPTSPSSPLLRRQWLAQYISSARAIVLDAEQQQRQEQRQSEPEPTDSFLLTTTFSPSHEWSLAARATLQTYGHVVTSLIEETISFDEDIAYWDNIVASRYNAALFTINTAPIRLANWFMELMRNIRQKIVADGFGETRASVLKSLSSLSLHKFREGLLTTLRHPLLHAQLALRLLLSPFKTTRVEARRQRRELVGLRNANAGAVGILLQHGCRFDLEKTSGSLFREVSLISTALMKSILHNDRVYVSERDTVAANAETNVDIEGSILSSAKDAYDMPNTSCSHVLEDLQEILQTTLHQHHVSLDTQMSQNRYSRPNALTRLWFPLTTFLLSSGIITSLITRHQVTLLSFIHDAADTVVAFGRNWVMTPCSKLLGIIRHTDAAGSDIALVSKASLQSDRDSLERMVFDFVTDIYNGEVTGFEQLKTKVQEGDLTSVLKAYEKDLRRPLVGTFRGGLIRAFLIQLQKTKVDVEVAMTGIDALLRSQELVFGCETTFLLFHLFFLSPFIPNFTGIWRNTKNMSIGSSA